MRNSRPGGQGQVPVTDDARVIERPTAPRPRVAPGPAWSAFAPARRSLPRPGRRQTSPCGLAETDVALQEDDAGGAVALDPDVQLRTPDDGGYRRGLQFEVEFFVFIAQPDLSLGHLVMAGEAEASLAPGLPAAAGEKGRCS